MNTAIIIGLFVLLLLILFLRSERKRGRHVYEMATDSENNKDYESACFYYALAMSAGHNKKLSERKVKELWRAYGPFEFKNQREEAESESCRYKSVGEGIYSLTLSDIQKIVK